MTAPKWLRVRLVLAAKSRARHVECLHYADDKPFLFEDRWINLAAVPRTENADLTAIVTIIFIAMGVGKEPAYWVYLLPLLPLALLMFTGLYMFVLPYATKWRSGGQE